MSSNASQAHWLSPLLAPGSVALVGASQRAGSVGNLMVRALADGRFPGAVTAVNPRYTEVEGYACVPTIADLPGTVDLAVLSVAATRMEQTLNEAIGAGVRAAVIFDPCFYEGDDAPLLLARLKAIAREVGLPVCGGNGMGFYNYDSRTFVSFQSPLTTTAGHIAAFCHSGSVFCLLANADGRFRMNLATSQGQEINASVADYMDYALEQPTTRVIAAFLETIRDPERFVATLAKAQARDIPVIVTKVARTPESARLAASHSGAIASSDSAFGAVCERYGVIRTNDMDELMATSQILALEHRAGRGGLAAVLDSGGLREQLIDLAADLGVVFGKLDENTVSRLRARLPHGLEPVNPLDAAGPLREDYEDIIIDGLHLVADDPDSALIAHEIFVDDYSAFSPNLIAAAKRMPRDVSKPYVVVNSFATVANSKIARELAEAGVPLINGMRSLVVAAKNAFAYRDSRAPIERGDPGEGWADLSQWRTRLENGGFDEADGLGMLSAFGIPTVRTVVCEDGESAARSATALGFPIALKTAAPGIRHKSDVDGVRLGLTDETAVREAYDDLSTRLGPRVAIATMAPRGVEIAVGMVLDSQFGPVVLIGAGGTLVEVLDDRVFVLPPFGPDEAKRHLGKLKLCRVLEGQRGAAPVDMDALGRALSRFSWLASELGGVIEEMDVNPIIASPAGCWAVDALVIPRGVGEGRSPTT